MKRLLLILTALLALQVTQAREWTNKEGKSFDGKLIRTSDSEVEIVRSSDGRHFTISRDSLSGPDNKFINQYIESIRLRELRKSIPDTYRKMLRKTKRSGRKTIVLYAPDFNREKLDSIIRQTLIDPEIMEIIDGKANLAILTEGERRMEAALPLPAEGKAINVFLYTDLFEHTTYYFKQSLDGYDFSLCFRELVEYRR